MELYQRHKDVGILSTECYIFITNHYIIHMLRFNLLLELHLKAKETKASYFFNRYKKAHTFPSKEKV
jgi:hypothetical protein